MKNVQLLALSILVLTLLYAPAVKADAAPPWTAQGAAIKPGEESSRVQMVSEEVLLTVEALAPEDKPWLGGDLMIGHVEAAFTMRNQGEDIEDMDVWFPLQSGDIYGIGSQAENFQVWVDGLSVAVEEAPGRDLLGFRDTVPWVKWPVTFPPGQDVLLRVTYDIRPIGYLPWGTFHYILETGAGWYGPIGEGTVTFRLPYQINEFNTVLGNSSSEKFTGNFPNFDDSPNPTPFKVSGDEIVWHFFELEPTAKDNVRLTVLAPSMWEAVKAAQQEVAASPDLLKAQLQLADTLERCLWRKHWILDNSSNTALCEKIDAAYQRALEIAPDDVGTLIAYLEWLAIPRHALTDSTGYPFPEELAPVLARALEVAPDDSRVLKIQEWEAQFQPSPTPTATIVADIPTPVISDAPPSAPTATLVTESSATKVENNSRPGTSLVLVSVILLALVGWRGWQLVNR